jgi:spore maturation protein A
VLGIGGASIPYGIKAIENMQENNSKIITFPMIMTIVFASSGIQILPTTIMGLITASGGKESSFVILPTLLASLSTTIVGVSLCLLVEKISQNLKRKKTK